VVGAFGGALKVQAVLLRALLICRDPGAAERDRRPAGEHPDMPMTVHPIIATEGCSTFLVQCAVVSRCR
jgi:hypothetical protein